MGFFIEAGFRVAVKAYLFIKGCGQVQFVGQRGPKIRGSAVPFFVLQYRIRWRFDRKNIQSDIIAPGKGLNVQNIDIV